MTEQQWNDQVELRIRDSEGCRLYKYRDNRGVVTLGDGFNMQRDDARELLTKVGANWAAVAAAPVARTSDPADAVPPCITPAQAEALFLEILPAYISEARASLPPGVFDALDDVRRFVVVDLTYNMGAGSEGWGGFGETHALLAQAVAAKKTGKLDEAHALFGQVADHLAASAWYRQTGKRAMRDVAMMRTSRWCDPESDGSDVL